jgi:hypothetical protein
MGRLAEEVRVWNTPIIGSFLLWEFTKGYYNEHPNSEAPIALLHFVASAILTNEELIRPISNKRNSLQSYIRSFEDSNNVDLLLSIQERTRSLFKYTLEAIDIGVSEGLFAWDNNSGKIYPKSLEHKPTRGKNLRTKAKSDGKKAYILGKWFAREDISTISAYLKVVF